MQNCDVGVCGIDLWESWLVSVGMGKFTWGFGSVSWIHVFFIFTHLLGKTRYFSGSDFFKKYLVWKTLNMCMGHLFLKVDFEKYEPTVF